MILAGIDEAGYGPLLGPLVVGCSAFRVPSEDLDLWKALRDVVTDKRDRTGRRLHVADSKQVYSPSAGLSALERGVLAFAGAMGVGTTCLNDLITSVDPAALREMGRHPWYLPREGEPFPLESSSALLGTTTNGLRMAMKSAEVEGVGLWARLMTEGRYNDLVGKTRNKATSLFSLVASLLHHLMENHAAEPGGLVVVCDRQGGREHYGSPLRTMFPDWHLTIELETPSHARYQLQRGTSSATIVFREKGESTCMATALASMLCKYLREAMMFRFNRYWAELVPGVAPTAGYYTDGLRFLGDISEARTRLAIPDAHLIRER